MVGNRDLSQTVGLSTSSEVERVFYRSIRGNEQCVSGVPIPRLPQEISRRIA